MRLINFGSFKNHPLHQFLIIVGGITIMLLASCSVPKKVVYFQDIPDSLKQKLVDATTYTAPTIQPDDILSINIQTLDPSATAIMSQQNTTLWPVAGSSSAPSGIAPLTTVSGYLVDKDGFVIIPLLGKVLLKDKSTDQAREEIRLKAAQFYKDPIVNVRYSNFKITILGEVARPSTYIMPNEKVTLLDAIGMAGDLTIWGKRENVLLIRDSIGKKEFIRFNLNESKVFASQYYYLRQGDVIYVEPKNSKVASTDANQVKKFAIISSAITLLIVIASRINY